MSHTPGPWVQLSYKYLSIDNGRTPQVFQQATEADERLMLAAPDLLDAAHHAHNALLDYVYHMENAGGIMGYGKRVIQMLEEAIIKTRG